MKQWPAHVINNITNKKYFNTHKCHIFIQRERKRENIIWGKVYKYYLGDAEFVWGTLVHYITMSVEYGLGLTLDPTWTTVFVC